MSSLALASRSPRRAALLTEIGVDYRVVDAPVDETPLAAETPAIYVERVARLKAAAGVHVAGPRQPLLAADTTVSLDGRLFGKPADADEASWMLRQLSGRWHDVLSAVVVVAKDGETHVRVVPTRVQFATLDEHTIAAYVRSGESADKAGAYAIQGLGGMLVQRIEGSYSAVVGLPLYETASLLDIVGVPRALRV